MTHFHVEENIVLAKRKKKNANTNNNGKVGTTVGFG